MDVFRQGKEEKPGWKWAVQKQPTNTGRFLFIFPSIEFCFVFLSTPVLLRVGPAGMKAAFSLLLAPSHEPLPGLKHIFLSSVFMLFSSVVPYFSSPQIAE